jgi:hypothetical protein
VPAVNPRGHPACHRRCALYETFPVAETRSILALRGRLDFRIPPGHWTWLNQAEIELTTFERSCLSQRVDNQEMLQLRAATLATECAVGDGRFATAAAPAIRA